MCGQLFGYKRAFEVMLMLMRICGRCGQRIAQGQQCACMADRHHAYDRERRDKARARFYHSREWRQISQAARMRAGYDEVIFSETGRLIPCDVVHHIEPIAERPDLRLSMSNLICVTAKTHRRIHAAYDDDPMTKRQMIARLREARSKRV